jgi:uncharacterized membrane protein YbhN (UPF0104 family)
MRWGRWLRAAATVVMLALLVPRIHLSSILPEWSGATAGWLGSALAVTAVAVAIAAMRWDAVLTGLGQRVPFRRVLHHYVAGLFVGNFLPSTIGGDVLRVRRLAADIGDTPTSFASVVLERVTGMLVLPAISLTALASNAGFREMGGASILAFAVDIAALVLFAAGLYAVSHPNIGGRVVGESRVRRVAGAVHLGADRFRRHPRAAAAAIVTALAYQLTLVFAALLAARAINIHQVGLTAALAFVPAVAIAQTLPISLGGLGVREGAFVVFLHPLHVPTGNAVALGLLVYGLNLAVSLSGAPSFAVG